MRAFLQQTLSAQKLHLQHLFTSVYLPNIDYVVVHHERIKTPRGHHCSQNSTCFFYVWVKTHYNRTKHPPINLCSHQISLNVMCVHALIGHLITKVFAVVMYGVFWCAFVLCRVFCQLYFQHSAPRAGPPLRKLTAKRRTMSKQDRTPKQFR